MNLRKISIVFVVIFTTAIFAYSQKSEISAGIKYYIGGTTPMGLPAEIRKITSFAPTVNLGIDLKYKRFISNNWGYAVGASFYNYGMKTGIEVKNYHLTMNIEHPDGLEECKTGYYTGKIKNNTQIVWASIPVLAIYRLGTWEIKGGIYAACAISRKFDGRVYGGAFRETPLNPIIAINRANYDYSDDLNTFDLGAQIGASKKIWNRLSATTDLRWGFLNMLNKNKRKIDMNTYNVYLGIGLSYQFN